ncbi:MAG: hypothetical protein LBV72_13560 [Tannerella sp.]|nr:hypothetical protein [Tannerella sp.]
MVISDETIHAMSTCGLLETWWDYPPRLSGPWCSYCSNSKLHGVSGFNNSLRADAVAVIMRAGAYAPCLDEVGTHWEESTFGYEICFTKEKYTKRYLNEQKINIMIK